MKKSFTLLFAILFAGTALKVNAQSNNTSNSSSDSFSSLIQSGPADATKLINAYALPLFKGFGAGMNSGWNNTAKTKKLLHFDLRISATAALAPTADKSFDVTKIGLQNVAPDNPSQTMTPTITGDRNNSGPLLDVYDSGHNQVAQFTMPKGVLPVVPSPQVQLTVGLPRNTDITVRAVPQISFGNSGSVSMFGFGLKHDIAQDFSTKLKPVPFDLAIAFGYSSLKTNIGLTVNPDPGTTGPSADFSNQHIAAKFNNFMIQAIISKKLLFFTPFFSVGYNTASINFTTVGNYPITTGSDTYTVFTNPVNIQSTPLSAMRADLGFQLDLAIFKVYASYGITSSYQAGNFGIGFGF